jgi:hypothetical protein
MTQPNAASAAGEGGAATDLSNDAIDAALTEPPVDEAFARRLGWRPQEEFRGPTDKWVDAGTFVEKVQKETPILRERLRTQDSMIQRMEAELRETKRLASEQGQAVNELLERSRGAEDRGFQYEAARIEAGMRKAVENADTPAYDALRMELDGLYRQRAEKQRKPADPDKDKPNGQQTTPDPAAAAWVRENTWFNSDKKLHRAAIAIEATLMEDEPHLSTADRLKKVRDEIVQRFPEKFENQARRQPSAVSAPGGQLTRPVRPKQKTVADLPDDAKQALTTLKRRDPKFTDEMYLKNYQWDK